MTSATMAASEGARGISISRAIWTAKLISLALLSCIFLQKVGLPIAGASLGIVYPILLLLLIFLMVTGRAGIDPIRLVLFSVFLLSVVISSLLAVHAPKPTSLILVVFLYLPLIFVLRLPRQAYAVYLRRFQKCMVLIAIIVVGQQFIQHTMGPLYWPNLNYVIPDALELPGYNYMRETGFRSGLFNPNGVFFLEPSIASQFFAVAIAIELETERSLRRLAALFVGILAVASGSGLVVLAVSLPFVAARYPKIALAAVAAAVAVVTPLAMFTSTLTPFFERMGEFSTPGTSGYMRYASPYNDLVKGFAADPARTIRGNGAGSTIIDKDNNTMVVTKAVNEYGLVAAILLLVMLVVSMFVGSATPSTSWAVFVFWLLGGGGLAVPIYTVPLILLGSLIRPARERGDTLLAGVRSEAAAKIQHRPLNTVVRSTSEA